MKNLENMKEKKKKNSDVADSFIFPLDFIFHHLTVHLTR